MAKIQNRTTTITGSRGFDFSLLAGFAGGSRIRNSDPATKIGAFCCDADSGAFKRLVGGSSCAVRLKADASVRLAAKRNASRFIG